MSETDHKLDHKVKAVSEDPIWHMHEYDVDLQSNHIYLFGSESYQTGTGSDAGMEPGVDYVMANRFIRNLNLCMRVNPNKPILIHMKTCGGDYTEGMAIYDAIKSCPFPVTILSYTHARSMSSLIFQAANKRVMMPNSYFMFHEGTLAYEGNYRTVMNTVEFDKLGRETMIDIYVENMKKEGKFKRRSARWIRAWIVDQMNKRDDVFLKPNETVQLGLADDIFAYNWATLFDYSEEQLSRG